MLKKLDNEYSNMLHHQTVTIVVVYKETYHSLTESKTNYKMCHCSTCKYEMTLITIHKHTHREYIT